MGLDAFPSWLEHDQSGVTLITVVKSGVKASVRAAYNMCCGCFGFVPDGRAQQEDVCRTAS